MSLTPNFVVIVTMLLFVLVGVAYLLGVIHTLQRTLDKEIHRHEDTKPRDEPQQSYEG